MDKPRKKRRWHWVYSNKTSCRPKYVLFLDTEATITFDSDNVQYHTFRLAASCLCVYTKDEGLVEKEWKHFWTEDELWNYVALAGTALGNLLVVAHNIDYDARVSGAFSRLPQTGFVSTYCIMSDACTIFVWKNGKCKITLADNMNLWRESLEALGSSVGVPKWEVNFDTVTDAKLLAYCEQDVRILVKLWQEWFTFLDEQDLGTFGFTAARQSFNAYRHRFMPCKIGIHAHDTVTAMERDAYRGGRTECFFTGKLPPRKYYKLDVNGLYAAMMQRYKYPRKFVALRARVSPAYLKRLLKDHLAIAEVVVSAREPVYVKRVGGRNCYPRGTFLTTLTTPELRHALAWRELRGIGRVALYEPADLFSDYVTHFTELRQQYIREGKDAYQRMCKLFLNTLQGKFGQKGYEQIRVGDARFNEVWKRDEYEADTGAHSTLVAFGGSIARHWQEGEGRDAFPAIPAHVCAYGRMYMWRIIKQAGKGHVFYTDTDSLIVDEVGFAHLLNYIDPYKLGYLKVEGIATDVEIMAKKDYKFGDLRVIKGIKDDAVQLAPDLYEQWHFTTMKYGFLTHNLEGVKLIKVQKRLRGGYIAGTVSEAGEVRPPVCRLNTEHLVRYLEESDKYDRSIWRFDPKWLAERPDLLFVQERKETDEWFRALFESAAQSLGPRPEPPSSA